MADFLSSTLSSNRLMLVPRGTWKTSLATAFCFWRVLRAYFLDGNSCHRVLIDSATVRLSQQIIRTIARYAMNLQTITNLFGPIYDRKGDKGEELSFSFRLKAASGIKEPNFLASGIGAEKTGQHFEDILLDDLVTKENIRTPLGRHNVVEHYRMMQAIIEASEREGQSTLLTINGTRYHDSDLYGVIIKEDKKAVEEGERPVFTKLIRQAVNPDTGELYYPSKLTKAALEKKKRVMKGLFYAQYQNDPNQDTAPFKPEWLKWESPTAWVINPDTMRLTIDTAIKDEQVSSGDYTAFVVAGWNHFYQMHVVDAVLRDDLTVAGFISEFIRLLLRWDIKQVIIEDDHATALRVLLYREMEARGLNVPIYFHKNPKNTGKESRWAELQPYAERGGIRISDDIPGATKVEIVDEFERAPFASHDDFMDALALQTVRLPVAIEEGTGRGILQEPGRPLAEIRKATPQKDPFRHGTLAEHFPHIRALQLAQEHVDLPPNSLGDIRKELMESLGAAS